MAAVSPTPSNKCLGTTATGAVDRRLKCVKKLDDDGAPVFTCATMRYFRVSCGKTNSQCNTLSGAFVASSTVCSQKLF